MSPTAQRSLLIDVVKGIAIILVALGHVNQGYFHRTPWRYGQRLDAFIYKFHMPAFFFVSGTFLASSLRKRGLRHFTVSRVKTILYPFWLWPALAFPLIPFLLRRFVHTPPAPLHTLLLNPLTGNLQWFLPALFFASLVAALCVRMPMAILFGLSWLLSMYWWPLNIAVLDRGTSFLPFLVAGMWLGTRFDVVETISPVACAVLGLILGILVLFLDMDGVAPISITFVPLGLAGTAMLMLFARTLGQSAVARGLAWVGLASLAVFLFGAFGQGVGRVLLDRLHIHAVAPHLLLETLLAVLAPTWLYHHRERLRLGWMFIWPF